MRTGIPSHEWLGFNGQVICGGANWQSPGLCKQPNPFAFELGLKMLVERFDMPASRKFAETETVAARHDASHPQSTRTNAIDLTETQVARIYKGDESEVSTVAGRIVSFGDGEKA